MTDMIDEDVKEQYRSVQPPEELKGRVLNACKNARRHRDAMRKRLVSAAACFVVLIGAAGYGFSPVPQLSSGGAAMEDGVLCMAETSVQVEAAAQNGVRVLSDGEILDGCICFDVDRACSVNVSAGALYAFDSLSGFVYAVEMPYRAAAGETLYWYLQEEGAALSVRSGVRTVTLSAERTADGWTLKK